MKKFTFITILCLALPSMPKATAQQTTVRSFEAIVSEVGQLANVLGDKANEIDSLIVKGPINGTDFETMWKCAYNGDLSVINLENAQLEGNKVPDFAFYKPDKQEKFIDIRHIILPEGTEEIGFSAFYCTELETINLPASLKKIGFSAFRRSFLSVDPLVIPEGVEVIEHSTFYGCKKLNKVVLPSTIKKIEESAFYDATQISEINFPDGLEEIELCAFYGTEKLEKIILPNSCLKLGYQAFADNFSLRELRLPEELKWIPDEFLMYSRSIETIELPKGLESIGFGAFEGCANLKSVNLPDGILYIDYEAFRNCALDSVVFPASIQTIGSMSYAGNPLKKIYSLSETPPHCEQSMEKSPFWDIEGEIPVYVPVGSGFVYSRSDGWKMPNLKIIECADLPTSGIENIIASDSGEYEVYSIDGQLIMRGTSEGCPKNLLLPKGVYIIRQSGKSYKIKL